jgi:xylulokinase
MIADVTGVLVEVVAERDVSAIGAALLAAISSGMLPPLPDAADRVVRIEHTYVPRKELAVQWDKRYQRYNTALRLAREYYHSR